MRSLSSWSRTEYPLPRPLHKLLLYVVSLDEAPVTVGLQLAFAQEITLLHAGLRHAHELRHFIEDIHGPMPVDYQPKMGERSRYPMKDLPSSIGRSYIVAIQTQPIQVLLRNRLSNAFFLEFSRTIVYFHVLLNAAFARYDSTPTRDRQMADRMHPVVLQQEQE